MFDARVISESSKLVRSSQALIHCITNYVTANDCANILLAFGGSPVMADAPEEVVDITSISSGLCINIGTLNKTTVEASLIAGRHANELGIPVTLDPVGVGASVFRTETALLLLKEIKFSAIRGNMSEMTALIHGVGRTNGVDVAPDDCITESNWRERGELLKKFARTIGTVAVASGPVDVITDGNSIFGVHNGTVRATQITGCGCMLTSVVCLWIAACRKLMSSIGDLESSISAVTTFGICSEVAENNTVDKQRGNGTFRCELIDAASILTSGDLEKLARVESV